MRIPCTRITTALVAILFFAACACFATCASADDGSVSTKLPDAVASSFAKAFPKAVVVEVEAEVEHGVMVYDVEFHDGDFEKETDIAADGTMLEFSVLVAEATVPEAAMAALRKAAANATLHRIERIELDYEIREGKLIKLPKRVTNYEALLSLGEEYSEVTVSASGDVVEAPEWGSHDETSPDDEAEPEDEAQRVE